MLQQLCQANGRSFQAYPPKNYSPENWYGWLENPPIEYELPVYKNEDFPLPCFCFRGVKEKHIDTLWYHRPYHQLVTTEFWRASWLFNWGGTRPFFQQVNVLMLRSFSNLMEIMEVIFFFRRTRWNVFLSVVKWSYNLREKQKARCPPKKTKATQTPL